MTLDDAARNLGVEAAAVRAVWQVESGGRLFEADGSPRRRFEPHQMPEGLWPVIGFAPGKRAPWRASLALSASAREAMFHAAMDADTEAACRATSWGGPQIMGFNHALAGHDSARAMVAAFTTEAGQIAGFAAFILARKLHGALAARDWLAFARGYNGTGQPEHYARLMEAAYRAETGAKSPEVLRLGSQGEAVRRLQRALGVPDDGTFGPATEAAVRALQGRNGLVVDGIVGARTWAALEAGGAEKAPAQPTQTDATLDRVAKTGAAIGPLVAAAGGVLKDLPPLATYIIIGTGCALALMAGAAWTIRKMRAAR